MSKSGPESQTGFFSRIKTAMDKSRLGELLVLKGFITSQDLRFALEEHKRLALPLGQIFLLNNMISKRQLAVVLTRQTVLRTMTAALFFMGGLLPNKKVSADGISDIPAQVRLSNLNQEFTKVAAFPGLFGASEKRSGNLSPFTKWTGMFARFEREMNESGSSKAITKMKSDLERFKGLSLKSMAGKINTMMNDVPYILDNKNWGQSDYWATPVEFLQRGGDCEDYAIAKYTALRALGVPEERLRVAIVHDKQKNIPHAVLVVYTEDGTFILDNQNPDMLDGEKAGRYRPIFSINRQAWWLHSAPGGTIVASAQ